MKMNGSEILIKLLLEQGVDTIFGYPGGAVLNIYDELFKNSDKIKHVLTSHEQNATHAADGYARVTGKVGVMLATSGPGATNTVTGIANAYMDSVPMVVLCGNVAKSLLGRDSFQEIDISGITMPITKNNYIVDDVKDLAWVVREAFEIAISGRPGPVLIDIAKNVTAEVCEFEEGEKAVKREFKISKDKKFDNVATAIAKAKNPLIYAGGGVVFSGASEKLRAFAERIDAPVALSAMGLTALSYNHPLCLGMVGMHGTPVANLATTKADLVIAIGARFDDRVAGKRDGFATEAQIIHIDIDTSEHSKNVKAGFWVHGDASVVLDKFLEIIPEYNHSEWKKSLYEYQVANPLPQPYHEGYINICMVLEEIHKNVGHDAIIVTDVGQHQMLTAQHYKFKEPRTFVSSCGLGTMGYGLGAAIGAKTAFPERDVVLVTGDGSFHMNLHEMATVATENLGIKVCIINNKVLGMVRQWQRMFYGARYSQTSINRKTNYKLLAEAFGVDGYSVSDPLDVARVTKEMFSKSTPAICEYVVHEDDSVFPIIPPGMGAEGMVIREGE